MNKWPNKFVIGLTGNIATGKSVVRKMLEHLGAYSIDADALAHRAIAQGSPGYQRVVDSFGKWVLDKEGRIDRAKLARLVFSDAQALKRLESIVHPIVRQAIDLLVQRAPQPVIIIEAIKLLEGDLRTACDSIWVTDASPEIQLFRLMAKRGMSEVDAKQRIGAQGSQEAKIAAANVVIHNNGSFEETWRQVLAAWKKHVPDKYRSEQATTAPSSEGMMVVQRALPKQAAEIASFINRVSRGLREVTRNDIMAEFGDKAFLGLWFNGKLVGVLGWQVENLVARTADVFIDPEVPQAEAARLLIEAMENSSRDLQCEVSLLFLPPRLAQRKTGWLDLGYEFGTIEELGVRAWQDAARESMPPDTVMLFKPLRQDRVLRPM